MNEKQKQIKKLLRSLEHRTNERAKAKLEKDAESYNIAEANRENTITELIRINHKIGAIIIEVKEI